MLLNKKIKETYPKCIYKMLVLCEPGTFQPSSALSSFPSYSLQSHNVPQYWRCQPLVPGSWNSCAVTLLLVLDETQNQHNKTAQN